MVRRTFVVVFPCPYSWSLGAATLKPFRSGGKDSGNLKISGFVSMALWLILLHGLVGFSSLQLQFHHSPVLAEIKKAKILHVGLNSKAALLSWEDWSRLFFSQHIVSEHKVTVPTGHQCVPAVAGCGTALSLIVKIAASWRWCLALTPVYCA